LPTSLFPTKLPAGDERDDDLADREILRFGFFDDVIRERGIREAIRPA
jgi:hypothetical protein